jgi:hypothetical protein
MPDLDRLLADNLTLVLALVVAAVVVLAAAVLVQSARLRRAVRAYRDLVRDDRTHGGGSLHELLAAHAEQIEKARLRMGEIEDAHRTMARRGERAIQHVGVVRFNPFEDTGSDQSFALALLDGDRDGVVVSSLHGRQTTRVFAKPIAGGASPHALSDEEADAIRLALGERAT